MVKKRKNQSNTPTPSGDGNKPPMFNLKWVLFFTILFVGLMSLSSGFLGPREITWSEFRQEMLASGDVERLVVVNKEKVEVYIKQDRLQDEKYKEVATRFFGSVPNPGPHYYFTIGSVETFEADLREQIENNPGLNIPVTYETRTDWWSAILSWVIPLAIIVMIWFFILGRIGGGGAGGGGSIFSFGKAKAVVFEKGSKIGVTFDDVAGLEEAKVEVKEVVEFLKHPERYTRLGAKIPKGILLVGPPGTGKTLLAKAVAGEAGVPFLSLSGSEFIEMFVGVGASRVRDLFDKAKEKAPSIVFIDEIDAIGRARGKAASFQANDERESTLNQLLTEMDGFDANTNVIVMAATNRAEVLDPALLRPGRFDRHIYLELPNQKERIEIFKVHIKPIKIAKDVDIEALAMQTPGFSGADIANMCNEAALIAARKKKNQVEMVDFMDALDRVVAGLERKSTVISPEEKRIIAYHESGHAIVSWMTRYGHPLVKISIIPRGKALGAAWYLPEEQHITTRSQFYDRLAAILGGRAAEKLVFDEISSGALDDLEKATKLAYSMVAYFGLDEELGNISYYDSTGEMSGFQKPYSEATGQLIDKEVRKILDRAYKQAIEILEKYREKLDLLATRLLAKEILHKEEIEEILGERPAMKDNQNKQTQDGKPESAKKKERTTEVETGTESDESKA